MLEALCADRVESDAELFTPNSWYGAARAVREYCGWPAGRPIPVILPHGVDLADHGVVQSERDSRLPAVYSFPRHRDAVYARETGKRVVPGCSPWLYLTAGRTAAPTDGGVLLMPAHSSHHVRAVMDDERFARAARERFPSETLRCCMYWRDVQHGRHRAYLDLGIDVVSAGHLFDDAFFLRLLGIFRGTRLLVTNDPGSHVFYAASIGIPVIVARDLAPEWAAPPHVLARDAVSGRLSDAFHGIESVFHSDTPYLPDQRAAADLMLGRDRMLDAEALYDLLSALARSPAYVLRALLPWRVKRLLRGRAA